VGLSLLDAYQLVSQAARSPIANVVDTNYTVLAKFPKRYLPSDLVVMGGAHERLRKLGAAHLAHRERPPNASGYTLLPKSRGRSDHGQGISRPHAASMVTAAPWIAS
jgi:hypothetical protein